MDITRRYEFSMMFFAFQMYWKGATVGGHDTGAQNCFYETFVLHSLNLYHAWRDEMTLLNRELTDDHLAIGRVMAKYHWQVMTYPRREPTAGEKPTLEENRSVFDWLVAMARAEGLDFPSLDLPRI